ncbi:MAG: tRNA (adenosine(37)-N6)-threonylcarbamoyltransferase complex transferase subunit TsaD, partial [Gemmatimonadota bacterium]
MIVLGVETTCDETAVSIVRDGRDILGARLATQHAHALFGGVVPEVAARAHLELLPGLYEAVLEEASLRGRDLEGIAVAAGPGLLGALIVGVSWSKGLQLGLKIPLVGVSHLEGHIFANRLAFPDLSPPFVALVVSGGHTLLALVQDWGDYVGLGETRDDACGEAFDKVAKLLGLGYPGGPAIGKKALAGRRDAIRFPRGMRMHGGFDFSYSGLKTAVALHVHEHRPLSESEVADVAASFEEAAVEILVTKATEACRRLGVATLAVGGGVAANLRLRELLDRASGQNLHCVYPPPGLCTDNASMIAAVGDFYLERGACSPPWLPAVARWPLCPDGKVFA